MSLLSASKSAAIFRSRLPLPGSFRPVVRTIRRPAVLVRSFFFTTLFSQVVLAQDASPTPSAAPSVSPTATPSVADEFNREVCNIFKRSASAIVRVEARDTPFDLVGTGFFVDPDGTLVTSYSIAGKSDDIIVISGETKYPAHKLVADHRSGVVLLKVDGTSSFPFLTTGSSHPLEPASPVLLIGYPRDLPLSPSLGSVASFDIQCMGRYLNTTHIRANVSVENGEAGAPLVNLKGEVVGITMAAFDEKAGCYALPVEAMEKIRQDYTRFGEARNGLIGINIDPTFTEVTGNPARISSFVKNSPAEKSGLQPGDIVTSVNDHKIDSPGSLLDASFYLSPGDKVAVTVLRDGKEMPFNMEAAEPSPTPMLTGEPNPINRGLQPPSEGVLIQTTQ
ncbi:MAG: S1C family serine protease [Chthoniobacteraceae bacterium]